MLDCSIITDCAREIDRNLIKCSDADPRFYFQIGYYILDICKKQFLKLKVEQEELDHAIKSCYEKMYDFISPRDMIAMIFEEICLMIEWIREQKRDQVKKPIREAKRFIAQNYDRNCSLEDIARYVKLSPVYLSALFKKETGLNITAYLTEVRIENAKHLLCETEMSIVQISDAVGYTDSRHFSKVFQKNVGMKPSQYRKLYQ